MSGRGNGASSGAGPEPDEPVLPEQTSDDVDPAEADPDDDDAWLEHERPPHWQ